MKKNKMVSTVTTKGQITIPVEIRKALKIESNTQVIFELKNDLLFVKPIANIKKVGGSLKKTGQKPLSIKKIREIRERGSMFNVVEME